SSGLVVLGLYDHPVRPPPGRVVREYPVFGALTKQFSALSVPRRSGARVIRCDLSLNQVRAAEGPIRIEQAQSLTDYLKHALLGQAVCQLRPATLPIQILNFI